MNKRNIVIIIGVLVLVGLGVWFVSMIRTGAEPGMSADSLTILPSAATSSGLVYTEKTDYYTISVVHPARTPLAVSSMSADIAARTAMQKGLLVRVEEFKKNLGDFDETMQQFVEGRGLPLALGITYEQYIAPNYISYRYDIYEDTGGAHPNGYYTTFVFDRKGKQVQLSDFFVAGSDYLERIAGFASVEIETELRSRLQGDIESAYFAEGIAPKAENFQNFVVDGDKLRFFFPPYQVAAYAAGSFDVEVPLSQLQGVLK